MCSTGEGQQEQSETAITVIFMGRRILIGRFSAPRQIKRNCILVGCRFFIYFFLISRCKQFDKTPKDHGSSGCRLIVYIVILLSNIILKCELYCSELTERTKNHQLLHPSIITQKSIQTG